MEGRKVDLFGVDKVVRCGSAEVIDIVGKEGVSGVVVSKEDYLGAARGESVGDGGADARGTTLGGRGNVNQSDTGWFDRERGQKRIR